MTTKASAKTKKPVCTSVKSTEQTKVKRITARVTTVPSLTPLSKQDQLAHSLSGVLMSPYVPTVQRKCSCGGSCDSCKKGGDDKDQETVQRMEVLEEEKEEPVQGKFGQASAPSETSDRPDGNSRSGMPARLKTGLESLSGLDLSPVRVHYNDPRPAKINAYAYTRGLDIHVAPGQEMHLPHEGWHTVQQMQGRVSPTTRANGVAINDSAALEREADVMGERAMRAPSGSAVREAVYNERRAPVQRSAWDLFGGKCCNSVLGLEWALVDGVWKSLETGECTGTWDDCDGMTCGGGFYHVDNFTSGTCVTPRVDDDHFKPRRWTPGDQKGQARSPEDEGSSVGNLPPGYEYDAPRETKEQEEEKSPAEKPHEARGGTKEKWQDDHYYNTKKEAQRRVDTLQESWADARYKRITIKGETKWRVQKLGPETSPSKDADKKKPPAKKKSEWKPDGSREFEKREDAVQRMEELVAEDEWTEFRVQEFDKEGDTLFRVEMRGKLTPGTVKFALTFDDGPHSAGLGTGSNRTEKVLDSMTTAGIKGKGAFFVQTHAPSRGSTTVGMSLIKRMSDEGYAVGIHTGGAIDHESHPKAKKAGRLEAEMKAAKEHIKSVTGRTPDLVRAPYGSTNKAVRGVYAKLSLKHLHWDIDGDAGGSHSLSKLQTLFDADLKRLKRGSKGTFHPKQSASSRIVVLYHDIRKGTSDNIAGIVAHIKARVPKAKFEKP